MTLIADLEQLSPEALQSLFRGHLLATRDLSDPQIDTLLRVARVLEGLDLAGVKLDLLGQELGYALFFDNSTRTKSAWAGASARLGMHPVIVDGGSTQVAHGETAEETGAMLGMNAHALGIRHDLILGEGRRFLQEVKRGIGDYLTATQNPRHLPIVNLQCDFDHPTQTLADLMWLQERFGGSIAGKKIAISWAYSPSYAKPLSVSQGQIMLLSRFGAHITLAHPEGYDLQEECSSLARESAARSGGSFRVVNSMDEAFEGAHIVYPKSWGPLDLMQERVAARDAKTMAEIEQRALERNAQNKSWICDESRMARTAGGAAQYLHCLPADIGAEVSAEVLNRFRVDLAREANKKVYVIMAVLASSKVENLGPRLRELASQR